MVSFQQNCQTIISTQSYITNQNLQAAQGTQKHVKNVENLKMLHVDFALAAINVYLFYE